MNQLAFLAYTLWNTDQNTITFMANHGKGAMETIYLARREVFRLPRARFHRNDHCFDVWTTEADGSGQSFADGAEFTMGETNVVLYAQWRPAGRGLFSLAPQKQAPSST